MAPTIRLREEPLRTDVEVVVHMGAGDAGIIARLRSGTTDAAAPSTPRASATSPCRSSLLRAQ